MNRSTKFYGMERSAPDLRWGSAKRHFLGVNIFLAEKISAIGDQAQNTRDAVLHLV